MTRLQRLEAFLRDMQGCWEAKTLPDSYAALAHKHDLVDHKFYLVDPGSGCAFADLPADVRKEFKFLISTTNPSRYPSLRRWIAESSPLDREAG